MAGIIGDSMLWTSSVHRMHVKFSHICLVLLPGQNFCPGGFVQDKIEIVRDKHFVQGQKDSFFLSKYFQNEFFQLNMSLRIFIAQMGKPTKVDKSHSSFRQTNTERQSRHKTMFIRADKSDHLLKQTRRTLKQTNHSYFSPLKTQ